MNIREYELIKSIAESLEIIAHYYWCDKLTTEQRNGLIKQSDLFK